VETLLTEQNIGYRLMEARKKLNLTQAELGARICLDQAVISRIEQGRHSLRTDTLFRLLSALGYELVLQPIPEKVESDPDAW